MPDEVMRGEDGDSYFALGWDITEPEFIKQQVRIMEDYASDEDVDQVCRAYNNFSPLQRVWAEEIEEYGGHSTYGMWGHIRHPEDRENCDEDAKIVKLSVREV